MTPHQKIPESLITYESLDKLVQVFQTAQIDRDAPVWQNLTGDVAVIADILISRVGTPRQIHFPNQTAFCKIDTPLYQWFMLACEDNHNEFRFTSMEAWLPLVFFMVDKNNITWKVGCVHVDSPTTWKYNSRCQVLRLFSDLDILPEPNP